MPVMKNSFDFNLTTIVHLLLKCYISDRNRSRASRAMSIFCPQLARKFHYDVHKSLSLHLI